MSFQISLVLFILPSFSFCIVVLPPSLAEAHPVPHLSLHVTSILLFPSQEQTVSFPLHGPFLLLFPLW